MIERRTIRLCSSLDEEGEYEMLSAASIYHILMPLLEEVMAIGSMICLLICLMAQHRGGEGINGESRLKGLFATTGVLAFSFLAEGIPVCVRVISEGTYFDGGSRIEAALLLCGMVGAVTGPVWVSQDDRCGPMIRVTVWLNAIIAAFGLCAFLYLLHRMTVEGTPVFLSLD